MNNDFSRIGIIDIGSNSIRLVIYETTPEGGYRIIKESKYSARLSEKITKEGRLEREALETIVPVLLQFKMVCRVYGVSRVRTGATAAIRNAANSEEITSFLSDAAEMPIEIISGQQEAYFGFLGVINAFDVEDGFVIDIGGGSTEITLFQNRSYRHSISFPFGAVNTNVMFGQGGNWSGEQVRRLEAFVREHLADCDWLRAGKGLPLYGLGGTLRTLGKMDQKGRNYSLPNSHGYTISTETIKRFMETLPAMSYDKRKNIDGLSKSRADIIVSGLIIFHTVYQYIGAGQAVISGEGLREGMLHDLLEPEHPVRASALEYSLGTLRRLNGEASADFLYDVHKIAQSLYAALKGGSASNEQEILIYVSAMLYRVGANINYYQSKRHTRYWLMNSPIRGLTHRQLVLCAMIASYSTKSRKQKLSTDHKDILLPSDEEWIHKLGSLVQLSAALDNGESGIEQQINPRLNGGSLDIEILGNQRSLLKLEEIDNALKVFRNAWDLKIKLEYISNSQHA
ncbi:exopolyphosphatase/guanosine-5'-triphosphate,3'-diphosphate pyrophosphatase [Paenibacillus forsythiae]|uniref:Exopolyphosphatase/guanosine-5'-triphosphate, 3'-diphosphate pyrophosphatase n=1 Tax=Paenibacillus forsythiae TaxID=365616 RepID=A0ABU3H1N7_9BACL|nr:Ppx/GppA family phosphatase [Paenibacillus forsythiae]MDT3424722.1 exopolyphosphatase/guanosine-5'-triphosphate,3'-diphosphate pyrophosphatase [Paenibacillus forsythiae]